jgi:formate-dependent nitrite reductase membrane component NrfD
MEIVLQTNWGWEIAMDLFLGGLGAGSFLITAIINLVTKNKFIRTIKFGAWASVISLLGAVLVLMLEVGIPQRAILLYQSFVNFDSWMPVGAWLLFTGIIIFGLYAISYTDWITKSLKFILKCRTILAIIGIILAIGITAYTGLLLSAIWVHPLWNTLWLPALIMASAFSIGFILITAYVILFEDINNSISLRKILTISSIDLIVLTGILLIFYLVAVSSGSEIGSNSVQVLTSGAVSQLFWLIAIGCGFIIPLLIYTLLVIKRDLTVKGLLPMLAVVFCLVGAFTLRLVILMAGLPIYA